MSRKKKTSQNIEPSGSLDNPFPKSKSSFTPKLWLAFLFVIVLFVVAALAFLNYANGIGP